MGSITDVPGIKVGHFTHRRALTGCTVILFESPAKAGFDIRGLASGTRQIDSLNPLHVVNEIHAILLTGGSSFGLDAAGGVMRYLEERGIGFDTGVVKIPIVPSAVLFDLGLGNPKIRPDSEMGYKACLQASKEVPEGSVGAGTGATVGKLLGLKRAMKGGLGTWSIRGPERVVVGVLVVVNAFGDVFDPSTGEQIAGPLDENGKLLNTQKLLKQGVKKERFGFSFENTTLVVLATNVKLEKIELTKLAQMASLSLGKVISPFGTPFDGDIVFAVSTGEEEWPLTNVAALAESAIFEAVKRAIFLADGFNLIPSWRDVFGLDPKT
jgi:L-aminopeptidase/D-esterase-like protein